jgi:hypothetical protein
VRKEVVTEFVGASAAMDVRAITRGKRDVQIAYIEKNPAG